MMLRFRYGNVNDEKDSEGCSLEICLHFIRNRRLSLASSKGEIVGKVKILVDSSAEDL